MLALWRRLDMGFRVVIIIIVIISVQTICTVIGKYVALYGTSERSVRGVSVGTL